MPGIFLDELRCGPVRSRSGNGGAAIPHVDSASVTGAAAGSAKGAADATAGRGAGRPSSPDDDREARGDWSWDRLERAVTLLVEDQQRLREEVVALRAGLADREQRIRKLETQLLEANQRRQDTGKRIDELISQLDQLDAQLASVEPAE